MPNYTKGNPVYAHGVSSWTSFRLKLSSYAICTQVIETFRSRYIIIKIKKKLSPLNEMKRYFYDGDPGIIGKNSDIATVTTWLKTLGNVSVFRWDEPKTSWDKSDATPFTVTRQEFRTLREKWFLHMMAMLQKGKKPYALFSPKWPPF